MEAPSLYIQAPFFAALPPPPAHQSQTSQAPLQVVHPNLPAQVPPSGPPQAVPVTHPITMPSMALPHQGKLIIITPQEGQKRPDSPVPPQGPPPKPIGTVQAPCTLATIDEQPIKMHIKKRVSEKTNGQWEVEEIPPKTCHMTRSRGPLLPPLASPDGSCDLVMDIQSKDPECNQK